LSVGDVIWLNLSELETQHYLTTGLKTDPFEYQQNVGDYVNGNITKTTKSEPQKTVKIKVGMEDIPEDAEDEDESEIES